ncbi:hypothetical protein [Desulfovibrio subterraneus]|uniref:Uncharacterized protein n=1 Tax=Desulfovibrio subterraneus TaxID=2718620 RepID=A0A7J0BIM8_9BACT|nr:hypothetical protein [Desulfovibrio subterraneus]GFM33015.1 hypothetical protein DSM101010T_13800 [Desulfovibrio subterraneus]
MIHGWMKDVRIVAAGREHLTPLYGRLRRSDCNEVLAATGLVPEAGLERSFALSSLVWAVLRREEVIALFGAGAGRRADTGSPWMLGTDALNDMARGFAIHSLRYIGLMRHRYPYLENWVDARNHASIRWLRRCGFTVEKAAPFGPFGLPFHNFHMGGGHVHHT